MKKCFFDAVGIDCWQIKNRDVLKYNGFQIFNQSVIEGSLIYNCDIIDTEKKPIINLSSGGKEFIITPQYDTTFDTIFSLLETISEYIDPDIDCSLYTHSMSEINT